MDDSKVFLVVARIPDSMLQVVNPSHELLIEYLANIYSTPTGILPPKVSSKGVEGLSKVDKVQKKKKQDEKP